jgi:hypothetical protein
VEDGFLPATLDVVRRCPARSEYLELCFTTPEGSLKWCFPEPSRRRKQPPGTLALMLGRFGVQAHRIRDGGELGPALLSSTALPMILAGAEVRVARELVSADDQRSLPVKTPGALDQDATLTLTHILRTQLPGGYLGK